MADTKSLTRYRLTLPGTAAYRERELVAAVTDAGWRHLQTRTDKPAGETHVFIAAALDTQEAVALELAARLPSNMELPAIRIGQPVDAATLHEQLARRREHRRRANRREVLPSRDEQAAS